ncbi:rhamnogalacturonan acetylesterase [Ferdinandcohnia quinoae]|uniref:Rhamnogalacturonan acetylesterase n=1 Tax=Fredinandcohnia quinoae TaxID=2918902 RepID=A0AAW5E7T0_9BACI|nr:rhamnogalacturonan acetylesterase [Fredinandcohnia sp. SECRCQ15]MCH1625451.1 rhamnogalacturonan acetylesterase [Fredinandcohnia sp. SECRCQ15]
MENEKEQYRIFIAGDSTVEDVPSEKGNTQGWGQQLPSFFSENVKIINEAKGGRSSKSFIDEGRLQNILSEIQKDDFLFIQFGHNDQKIEDPARGTDPYTTYQEYLTQYVVGVREKEAIPIFITSVNRRKFDEEGRFVNGLGDYPDAMRQLAFTLNVPLLDLCEKSKELYERLGVEQTKQLFAWYELENPDTSSDNTHFGRYGAREIAKLVIEGIKELQLPFAEFIVENE